MKQYQTTKTGSYILEEVNIPNDPKNRHYEKMLAEVAAGEAQILPYVAPPFDSDAAFQALYDSAFSYQKVNIDRNLLAEMQKSESIVEAGVLLEVDLPKAKACGDWLTALWDDYYLRKADIENSSTDFSNNGNCPHRFADVRDERKAALLV